MLTKRRTHRLVTRVFALLISLVVFASRRLYRTAAARVGVKARSHALVVLTYHAVQAEDVPRFTRQMQSLRRTADPVFADAPLDGYTQPTVAVTFDDAFQSVVDRAVPILANVSVPATIFVPTASMGRSPSWIHSPADRVRLGNVASADALETLNPDCVRLGSHTVTHPRLDVLTRDSLHQELAASKAALEAFIGESVTMLALPYGSYSATVIDAARSAGYRRVFANVPVRPEREAPGILTGRVDVSPRDWRLEFYLKLQGAYDWMALAVPAKRRVLSALGCPQPA